MNRLLSTALAVVSLVLTARAAATQDPLVVSPDTYRLAFENAWVKVVRVTYGPHAVVAPHFHTERASAYVYLNDGGPILFKHEGLPYAGVTRPPTVAGSFRLYKGLKEVHSVENPTATPSDFLRVEFKTEPLDDSSLRGKYFRDNAAPAAPGQRAQFENGQVRISRVRVTAGGAFDVAATATEPALLVALLPVEAVAADASVRPLSTGGVAWLDAGQRSQLRTATATVDALRFDFKSPPKDVR